MPSSNLPGCEPDEELLRCIANKINTKYDCTQLAIRLHVGSDFVTNVKERETNPNAIALEVLKKWSKGEDATRAILYESLDCQEFENIAREFKGKLLLSAFEAIPREIEGKFLPSGGYRIYAAVRSSAEGDHFCVATSTEVAQCETTGLDKQSAGPLRSWFRRVLQFDVGHVSFTPHPFVQQVPLFSLVNIILSGTLNRLSKVECEQLEQELVLRLQDIVKEKSTDTVKIRSWESFSNKAHFIATLPYIQAYYLLNHWQYHKYKFANLPFMNTSDPVINITSQLGDEHWEFNWDEVPLQSAATGSGSTDIQSPPPGQFPLEAREGRISPEETCDDDIIQQVFPHPYSLKSIHLLLDDDICKSQPDVIVNMPDALRVCFPCEYDFSQKCSTKQKLTSSDASSNKRCLTFVRIKKDPRVLKSYHRVKTIFQKRLAEVLEIHEEHVDVRFIGGGSVSVVTLVPLQAAQKLNYMFLHEQWKLQDAFRNTFGGGDEDTVLDATCVFNKNILDTLSTVEELSRTESQRDFSADMRTVDNFAMPGQDGFHRKMLTQHVLTIQRMWRSYRQRKYYCQMRAATILFQKVWRRIVQQRKYLKMKNGFTRLQATFLMHKLTRKYQEMRGQIFSFQCHCLGFLARQDFRRRMKFIVRIQTQFRILLAKRKLSKLRIEASKPTSSSTFVRNSPPLLTGHLQSDWQDEAGRYIDEEESSDEEYSEKESRLRFAWEWPELEEEFKLL